MKRFLFCLALIAPVSLFAQSMRFSVVRMTADQHVTLTFAATTDATPQWSLVDPAVELGAGQGPFRVAYIVTFAPSVDGRTCLITPKGRTPASDGLGTWEVQVRSGPRIVGRATLVIVPPGGATGIIATMGTLVVASGLTK